MEPLVSVIIPVYNVSPYLREALDSVIYQTYRNLEIIIVDDGSTDDSGLVCDKYKGDPRVKVIHQENRGLSGARNTGIDLMMGDFVVFLDSDDAFHPEMIGRMLKLLMRNEADLAACSFGVYRTEGRLAGVEKDGRTGFGEDRIYTAREAAISQMEGTFDEAAWNKLYRKELWDRLRFPEGYVYEDMRVMPFLYEQCDRIAVTSEELVYHRVRPDSITKTRTVRNMQDLLDAYGVLREYAEQANPPFPETSVRKMLETMMKTLTTRWAEMKKQGVSLCGRQEIRKEILRFFGKDAEFFSFRANTVWWLFCRWPGMLLPARNCWQGLRSILGRGNAG